MDDLLRRLRERKLVQWAVAYAAAAFAALQGFDIVAQRFGWPESIERGFIVAIVIGFFFTIVLAWYGPMKNVLALAEAGLGNANAALAALDSAAADLDKSGDVIERGRGLDARARVYAKLGRKDEAIDTLRQVMAAYYGGTTCTQTITTASLGLDPEFDGLRGDPRFQALEKPASATATSTATAPRP